jgi:hypothetical protein
MRSSIKSILEQLDDDARLSKLLAKPRPELRALLADDPIVKLLNAPKRLRAGIAARDPEAMECLLSILLLDERDEACVIDHDLAGRLFYCAVAGTRWEFGRFDADARAWIDQGEVDFECEQGQLRSFELSFHKRARDRWFIIDYRDDGAEPRRVYVCRGDDGERWRVASSLAELEGEPSKSAAKSPKQREPARYEVRSIGRSRGARAGRVAVAGHELVGVYDLRRRKLVLTPPDAVKIALAGEHAIVWAMRKRPRRSGVSREDYNWVIETWALDGDSPQSSYTVQDRDSIAWCWPTGITCAARTGYRLVTLSCRSEDYSTRIYIARRPDDSYFETHERELAIAALRKK